MEETEQNKEMKPLRFGEFFLSVRPNGYIGCLEYLVLMLIGWAVSGAAFFILWLIWGGGLLAIVPPMASSNHGNAAAVFSGVFSLMCGLCWVAGALIFWLYHARLLQLRMIDIGLGGISVPGIASRFSACFAAVFIVSLFTPLGLVLAVFCCVAQGRTYQDNRDLFMPIQSVPPADELARQMHERSEEGR